MNINNTCSRCEIVFNKELCLKKKNESANENLEPLDLRYKDTLICRECLWSLYQEKLISEQRWKKSKFNESRNNDNIFIDSLLRE